MAKRKSKEPRKPPQVCIFCQGAQQSPISGEHVWSDWAAKYFDRGAHDSRVMHREIREGKTGNLVAPPTRDFFHGHIVTMTLRVVCRRCNNEWMNRIEDAAKPTLTQLVEGRFAALSVADQVAVANWIALKFMVTDQTVPSDAVFTQAERSAFWTDKRMPDGLRIWIFHCGQEGWRSVFNQQSATFVRGKDPPPVRPDGRNIKSFALGFGDLFVYAVYARDPSFHDNPKITFTVGDTAIWPPTLGGALWPPRYRLTWNDAFNIAQTFDLIFRSPNVNWMD